MFPGVSRIVVLNFEEMTQNMGSSAIGLQEDI